MLTGDFYPEQIGGQGIYAFELAQKLAGLGVTVKVFAPATSNRREFAYPNGVRVRWLGPATQNPLVFSAATATLRAEILGETDVLHVNELFGFPFTWRLPDQQHGLVVASHNAYLDRFHAARGILSKLKYPPLIAVEGATYRFADRVLIGSEIERAPLLRLGVAPERIVLVPYGVDASRFQDPEGSQRAEVRRALGISPTARVVLFVGRFVERKKPQVVVRALQLVRSRDPNVHGILIGDGELMPRVREAAGSDPGIHLVGAVAFSELPRYYAAADAFTLPSIGEGSISLVVLEAAAAGLPLVLTLDSSGQSPIFDSGKNGVLVDLDDPESLADAILVALEHRDAYGAFSRGLVERHFSWETAARSTLLCYEAARRARSQRVGGTKHDSDR
jgi:glycosyltransferase involved in cell wall biosynthesis